MIDKNLNQNDVVNTENENQENNVKESNDSNVNEENKDTNESVEKTSEAEQQNDSNNIADKQRLIQERLAAIKNQNVTTTKSVEEKADKAEEEKKTVEEAKEKVAESIDDEVDKSEPDESEVQNKDEEEEKDEEPLDDKKTSEPETETVSENKTETEKEENAETPEDIEDFGFQEGLDDEEKESTEEVDYTTYSKEELISELKSLLEKDDIIERKDQVELIKTHFYKKHNAENTEKRKEFLENGGDVAEYKIEQDPLEDELKELYKEFKSKKAKHNQEIEQQKQENLKKKYNIIDQIQKLTESKESLNQTFHDFKELQQEWREAGPVPQSEIKNLWQTYNYQIEKFYDYIKINKELRDLDFKKNLELKMGLCEKAEELLLESNIVKAFRELQKYHAQWREIGPVPHEKREELWERFKEATNKINKKHQEYFESRKKEEKNNLKAKILLCEKAEELSNVDIKSHREWEAKSKEVIELQKIWKLIGFVPKKESNKIYDRFREACDEFFNKKREFYAKTKAEQETNLQLKTELCIQAEALSDSTEWKKTTEEYIKIQKDWKTIGPVARRHSDAIWKRFRTACNKFFERKNEHFSNIDAEQDKNLELKQALIEKIKSFESIDDAEANLNALKSFQKEWTQIGYVPIKKKDEVQKAFRQAINSQFEKLNIDERKRSELKFANKLKSLQSSPKANSKMRFEREKLINQLERIRSDIQLWENNIGFFAKSKNAESLIQDVKKKISSAKRNEASIIERLKMMDNYSEQ